MANEREAHSGNMVEESAKACTTTFCDSDEQRRASRFRRDEGTDFAVIWRESGEELLAEVHDESLTGLGILVDAGLDLRVGSQVHVVYAGEYLQGEVRHITPQSGETNLVGLRCDRLPPMAAE